jgi:ribosomal silencing factor RsfS
VYQLSLNPIKQEGRPPSDVRTKVPRPKKGDPPSEWALIDTGVGIVVHVMTGSARERWGVEGVWDNPHSKGNGSSSFGL